MEEETSSPLRRIDARGLAVAGIGIFLVVVGHSTGVMPDRQRELIAINTPYAVFIACIQWIYVFHMPLFFVMSGYNMVRFSRSKPGRTFTSFLRDRIRRLLIPYVLISSLAYPIKAILGHFSLHPIQWTVNGYFHTLVYPWDNTIIFFWFLPSLFFSQLLCWVLVPRRPALILEIAVVLVCLFGYLRYQHTPEHNSPLALLNAGGVFHNLIFVVAGALAAKYSVTLSLTGRSVAGLLGAAATIVAACIPNSNLLQLAGAAGGIAMVFMFAARQSQIRNPFVHLGIYSFQIYLFSWFAQIVVRIVLGQVMHANIWLVVFSSVLAGLAIPIWVTKCLNAVVPARRRFVYGL